MCGIAGVAAFNGGFPPNEAQLKAMCNTLMHRGPDGAGMHLCDGVALGMRRLAIIDLKGGNQPIFNEDHTILTVFNGEIYNFRELRRSLESAGHTFRTQSDTEVIVHAYEEYGMDFPTVLNGMFAIAVYDSARKTLYLVRDPVGIKPLYYSCGRRHLVWGSEIKAVLASGLVRPELNVDALGEFLCWEYIPGKKTLFHSIHKLEPGHILRLDLTNGGLSIRKFWDLPAAREAEAADMRSWEDRIDQKIRECVRRQLVSDVPLGAFLSGGVDSSIIVAAMGPSKTFSIGFDDPTYNELHWARKVARHLGVEHKDGVIRPDIVSLFEHLIDFLDEPIGDFSIFPTYLVSKHTREYVTVALSGDGGDELFGGYETYVAQELSRIYERIPRFVRERVVEPCVRAFRPTPAKKGLINKAKRFVEGLEHPKALAHARWRLFLGDTLRGELFTKECSQLLKTPPEGHITDLFLRSEPRDDVDRCLYVDFKSYLVDNCLLKVDRMSMAVSLEVRVPYLDKELVELVFRMPGKFKVSGTETKVLLKRIAARHVPRECAYRPKEGFSIPIKNWLKQELRPLMEDLLCPRKLNAEGIFRAPVVERLKREHLEGRANHSHLLWSLMVYQAWSNKWLKGGLYA